MIMQILLIPELGFRSKSAWWYENSLYKEHLEVVTDEFITKEDTQQGAFIPPKLFKLVIDFSWRHVLLSVILIGLIGFSLVHS